MKKILIVDDSKANLRVAENALGDIYETIAVSSGERALEYLGHDLCDLVLLDINMPEMDGFEVMSKIKQMDRLKDIPIIFLTADNDAVVESKCLEAGAQDFIVKPFVKNVIRSRIGRTLELEELRANLVKKLEKKTQEVIEIQSKSLKDPLTGLWNRAYTETLVDDRIKAGDGGSLFMMDLDNFKAVNDTYGHMAGDCVLKMMAEALESCADDNDVLCRIGGDEFVMYLGGEKTEQDLRNSASKIIELMEKKIESSGFDANLSVSIGIAISPVDGDDFSALYRAADKALYYVKQNGKNSYYFFGESRIVDKERTSNLVDLQNLNEMMTRADAGRGVYKMEYDSFHHIYNFIRRFVERSEREVHTVLFTAQTPADKAIENEELELAINTLEQSIYTSLRRVDISTRYSTKQLIVILLDADMENSKMVAERILDNFRMAYTGKSVTFDYGIAKLGVKESANPHRAG